MPPPQSQILTRTRQAINAPLSPSDTAMESLVDALARLSATVPTDIAYTFLPDGEGNEQNITFRELEWRARSIAARLQKLAPAGERAALVYESGIEYIAAIVGCFYAGIVAVPIYPPDPMRIRRMGERLQAILEDAAAKVVLTGQSEFDRIGGYLSHAKNVVVTDDIAIEDGIDWRRPEIGPDTLALLQYTSGSTGRPRGVMLTHANLMFNLECCDKFDQPDGVIVSWLPMYHDMGLIGLVLQVLKKGRRAVIMSPLSFAKCPARWLQAISKYRAFATSGPNFAYDLCVQKVEEEDLAKLDLSCWTLACIGAEPVRPDTLERFAERFAPAGFRREAFYPCFGLAEATLMVSGGEKSAPPIVRSFDPEILAENRVQPLAMCDGGRRIVGCGTSVENQEVAIVDPQTFERCASDEVGEIWVRGPGVAQGYWNDADATRQTFEATIADTNEGSYLRTGDNGFIDQGELFVTGRLKDLIIVRGRNHYPQDLEHTVEECHPLLRRDHGVAFSVESGGDERVVIVFGVRRLKKIDVDQLFSDIRGELLHKHEVAPHAIVLVNGREIPKTSSGKLQRRACKELYENGELKILAEWNAAATPRSIANGAVTTIGVAAHRSSTPSRRTAVLQAVAEIVRGLRNDLAGAEISERTLLLADLAIESIDLVMLNELVAQHFQHEFPFTDFMAELGRRDQRDVLIGEFVDFLLASLESASNTLTREK